MILKLLSIISSFSEKSTSWQFCNLSRDVKKRKVSLTMGFKKDLRRAYGLQNGIVRCGIMDIDE